MRKYGLGGEFEFLNILHPAHVSYMRHPPLNTLDYFFSVLDLLDPAVRRSYFTGSFLSVINPEFDEPTDPKRQTLGELARGKMTYTDFRNKCYDLAHDISPHFLIQGIVFHELAANFNSADKTSIQQTRDNMQKALSFFQLKIQKPNEDQDSLAACIRDMKDNIEHIEERTAYQYERYCSFCDKVVGPLLQEELPMPAMFQKWMDDPDL
jgi:hypothetical protein